jgi:hypothetical protein
LSLKDIAAYDAVPCPVVESVKDYTNCIPSWYKSYDINGRNTTVAATNSGLPSQTNWTIAAIEDVDAEKKKRVTKAINDMYRRADSSIANTAKGVFSNMDWALEMRDTRHTCLHCNQHQAIVRHGEEDMFVWPVHPASPYTSSRNCNGSGLRLGEANAQCPHCGLLFLVHQDISTLPPGHRVTVSIPPHTSGTSFGQCNGTGFPRRITA